MRKAGLLFSLLCVLVLLGGTSAFGRQPENIEFVGGWPSRGTAGVMSDEGVFVSGNYAFVANGYGGFKVIDVSDPASPEKVGSHETPDYACGVHVSGKHAFVTDWYGGLQIIDVSDPTSPRRIGSHGTPERATDVHVSGNYAYVTDRSSGLQVIDVRDPASPKMIGSYDTGIDASGVYVSSNYAYVTGKRDGLQILRFVGVLLQPNISIVPTRHDFGSVGAGMSSMQQEIMITNTGDSNLEITSIQLTGRDPSDFSILTDSCSNQTIGSSEKCSVGLVFSTMSEDEKTANLMVRSNDRDTPTLDVLLTGIGGMSY